MTTPIAWQTDDPCPVCATGLTQFDDGTGPPRTECRLCGWSGTWASDNPDDRGADHPDRGGQ